MSATPPRRLALRVLRDIERRRGFSNRILSQWLAKAPGLEPRDKGLVTTLVYGVLRHRGRLDHQIDRAADEPRKLKGELREILRLAAYELLELQRPRRVVADECSKLARQLDRGGKLTGLVTAIVSHIDEHGARIDAEAEAGTPLDALDHRWSLPRWLAGKWIKQLGPEIALARARALASPPPVDLRVDVSRTTREHVVAQLRGRRADARFECPEDHPQSIRLRGGADSFHDPLHGEGLISIMGLGSQQAALGLAPRPGQRVLDACAGMGGKSLHLAELMRRQGSLTVIDTDAGRLREFAALRTRGHLDTEGFELNVVEADATDPGLDLGPPFDAILLDAPCTGLGNLARHPELRTACRYEDIQDRAALQLRLLEACAARLAVGGRLVYAVCSLEPEEGRGVVEAFAGRGGLELLDQQDWTPEKHGTDGFYVALLRRSASSPTAG